MNLKSESLISPTKDFVPSVFLIPMTSEEEKNLIIKYSFHKTRFGKSLIASTERGICFLAFGKEDEMFSELKHHYPFAYAQEGSESVQFAALNALENQNKYNQPVYVHVHGTEFQLKVWNALLKIPQGKLTSYHFIAEYIGNSNANRAVGTAVGANPVSYFIPCHRVIRTDGSLGGYRWGLNIKEQLLIVELIK
jgi:AraC family transcriptional regulator of adaptative response/methylated-DNA-[protein]-cysteine methyltransferase